ncbi:hypothetical protein GR160_05910 [Flavobacterium sp. Sd200]|nr:hypothetical protein [Flavobacterium sp. Sd200]MXN90756.1 hypothetical protein [Flavobacterium sp. Sd200]
MDLITIKIFDYELLPRTAPNTESGNDSSFDPEALRKWQIQDLTQII